MNRVIIFGPGMDGYEHPELTWMQAFEKCADHRDSCNACLNHEVPSTVEDSQCSTMKKLVMQRKSVAVSGWERSSD